jgi:hypothetical protein
VSKVTPYKTSTGLQIGLHYQPPKPNYNSREAEFWQGILLGLEPTYTRRKAYRWGLYIAALAAVFFLCSFIKD